VAERKRGAARAVAIPARRGGPSVRALVPSRRSAAVGVAILALAGAAYAAALETSVFAARTLAITGGSPRVRAEVRRALEPELGRSLLRIGAGDVDRRVAAIPDVVSVSIDRSFPHTLRVRVRAERAVLLLRRATDSFVVSARGRVMRTIERPERSSLPRLWMPKSTPVTVGETLGIDDGGLAAAAVAPLSSGVFRGGVRTVIETGGEVTLVLRDGPRIRLGGIGDLYLKLTIAKRIMRLAGAAASTAQYIDVSVPERPVLGSLNSQVASTG
jgi:cell division protein FtsQ